MKSSILQNNVSVAPWEPLDHELQFTCALEWHALSRKLAADEANFLQPDLALLALDMELLQAEDLEHLCDLK